MRYVSFDRENHGDRGRDVLLFHRGKERRRGGYVQWKGVQVLEVDMCVLEQSGQEEGQTARYCFLCQVFCIKARDGVEEIAVEEEKELLRSPFPFASDGKKRKKGMKELRPFIHQRRGKQKEIKAFSFRGSRGKGERVTG